LLLDSDVLVGTSAGSAVAAQISSGCPIEELFGRQIAETSAEIDPGRRRRRHHRTLPRRTGRSALTVEQMKRIGRWR